MLPPSDDYILMVRQGPQRAKVAGPKEKGITAPQLITCAYWLKTWMRLDRKPIDPPPIIQLQIRDFSDPAQYV